MKKFLSRPLSLSLRPQAKQSSPTPPATNTSVSQIPIAHTTGLQPKDIVPPLPHPFPDEHIAILITTDGLLLRSYLSPGLHSDKYVRIAWQKEVKIEEVAPKAEDIDWSEAVIVYGIIGVLNLFTASHLLVISSRSDVGYLFDPKNFVYSVKGVTVIPLVESRAREAIQSLAKVNSTNARPSLLPPAGRVTQEGGERAPLLQSPSEDDSFTPRVKFASDEQVKVMTPLSSKGFDYPEEDGRTESSRSPSPTSSVGSTPSSEYGVGNVVKTLTDRLSFWSRVPIPGAANQTASLDHAVGQVAKEDAQQVSHSRSFSTGNETLDNIIRRGSAQPAEVLSNILRTNAPPPATTEQKNSELEEKIIRETVNLYSKGGMYFAYHFDITRSLQHKQELVVAAKKRDGLFADLNIQDRSQSDTEDKVDVLAEPSPTLPLWRRVDRRFWWNEWLSKPFIDAGLHTYVLPIMQGFYQIASFGIPREPEASEEGEVALVDYILVSRRSRDRAGLRYQRRGIDDDANVANFVETETIMRVEREGFQNVFSHIQIRGSIPLFWHQPGYSLKPAPVLSPERTHAQNVDALRRHLQWTVPRYGPVTIVNLAEQRGKEGLVTTSYRECVGEAALKDVQYCEYDFHTETKGMKYENISQLIEKMERTFESQGYLWISNNLLMSQQKGIFRVNCIDCLDRTNVVESAFARYVLTRQLGSVALQYPTGLDKVGTDIVFNDVWANNGDAISREYAGTSALKGDFTRTGKRDLTGLLNDGVNSLARMYTSTFGDWFSQAVIDFALGNRNLAVFSEFLLRLQSTDPRDLIRISKIRAEAIADCVSRVISEGERLLSGWTLFSPVDMNVKTSDKFEEKVLLLSVEALYIVSYDYSLEKVKIFTRVPLGDIIGITKGTYILSPLEEASRDPLQNYGFTISWQNIRQDTRVTSYSIRNSVDISTPPASPSDSLIPRSPGLPSSPRLMRALSLRKNTLSRVLSQAAAPVLNNDVTFAAFKALPIDPARSRRENGSFFEPADELTGATNCQEAVNAMVEAIHRACLDAGGGREDLIKDEDIVSLADAQRMTSVYAKMEYGMKRLLWLGD